MVRLRRTVRFSINPGGHTDGSNGFGGVPAMRGLGRYYELDVACTGEPDPHTGYLIDIRQIDRVVRTSVVPLIAEACALAPETAPVRLLPSIVSAVSSSSLGSIFESVTWRLTPYHAVAMNADDTSTAVMLLRFDLAAAHRLHVPELSDEQNAALFGRCNNPSGHGHNYQVEVAVRIPLGPEQVCPTPAQLEQLVDKLIIQPFDHKHLNLDTREFAPGSGVNPSVENIARVFFETLAGPLADAFSGTHLVSITVWETDRTRCTYPA